MKKFLLFLVLILSACAVNEEYIPKTLYHPLATQILTIDQHRVKMLKLVKKEKYSLELQEEIVELNDFFKNFEKTVEPPLERLQDRELLNTYCALGQRILEDLIYHIQRRNRQEALDALDRIRSIEQNLLRDFAKTR